MRISCRNFCILIILWIICFAIGACSQNSTYPPLSLQGENLLSLKWSHQLTDTITDLSGTDLNSILAQTTNTLYSLDPVTGEEQWKLTLSNQLTLSPAIAVGDHIYITDNKFLYALNQRNGYIIWRQPMSVPNAWVVSGSENLVIVNQPSESINVYDSRTGSLLWDKLTGRGPVTAYSDQKLVYILDEGISAFDWSTGNFRWVIGSDVIGASDYQENTIFYTTGVSSEENVNRIIAFNTNSQNELWEKKVQGSGFIKIKAFDNALIVYNMDYIYALNKINGNLIWQVRITSPINPTEIGNTLYVMGGFNRVLYSLNIETGKQIGSQKVAPSRILLADDQEMISSQDLLILFKNNEIYTYGK
jgi:outer membrane protein assembly factor BamB